MLTILSVAGTQRILDAGDAASAAARAGAGQDSEPSVVVVGNAIFDETRHRHPPEPD